MPSDTYRHDEANPCLCDLDWAGEGHQQGCPRYFVAASLEARTPSDPSAVCPVCYNISPQFCNHPAPSDDAVQEAVEGIDQVADDLASAADVIRAHDDDCLFSSTAQECNIVAIVNAAPTLIATTRDLRAERDTLRELGESLDKMHHYAPQYLIDRMWGAYRQVTNALAAAQQEAADLREWKRSAMEVEAAWDVQEVGKRIGARFGTPIREQILPAIIALQARAEHKLPVEGRVLMRDGSVVDVAEVIKDSDGTPVAYLRCELDYIIDDSDTAFYWEADDHPLLADFVEGLGKKDGAEACADWMLRGSK